MGVGAACIMPAPLSIIADLFRDPRERTRAIGLAARLCDQPAQPPPRMYFDVA